MQKQPRHDCWLCGAEAPVLHVFYLKTLLGWKRYYRRICVPCLTQQLNEFHKAAMKKEPVI